MPYQLTVQRNLNFFNVKDFGAQGNGVTDDTSAITAAIIAANTIGGGTVFFPSGTYISGNQTLYSKIHLCGAGIGATIIKLKNGANTDLFSAQTSSINIAAAYGTGIIGTLTTFSIRNLTIDGNKANQTAGPCWPIRFYGYNFLFRDLEVLNGYSGGILTDWNNGNLLASPSDEMESLFEYVKVHDCNGIGILHSGPHDSAFHFCLSFNNTSHGFHIAPNAQGTLMHFCHPYHLLTSSAIGIFSESGGTALNGCMMEGSDTCQVVLLGNDSSIVGGENFNVTPSNTSVGIQIGQAAGGTPIPGQVNQNGGVTTAVSVSGTFIDTKIVNNFGGAFKLVNENNSHIIANIYQGGGTSIFAGGLLPNATDTLLLTTHGLTSDKTLATTSGLQLNSGGFSSSGSYGSGTGINVAASTNNALAIETGGDTKRGLYIIGHSPTQSGSMLEIVDSTFTTTFIVNGLGEFSAKRMAAGGAGLNSNIAAIVKPDADGHTGLMIYPNSATQAGPLLDLENSSFASVFTVYKEGNILAAGFLSTGQSATAAAIATGSTITTTNIGVARVAPTGNVTAIVLQAGIKPAQHIVVLNESAFSVTFDVVGTSHVSGGASISIAGGTKQIFVWNSSTNLWY